jgi:hypothetical protein
LLIRFELCFAGSKLQKSIMKSLVIFFFLISLSTFCQDQKAKEIIEKYKEAVGKERWTKTIIYRHILPNNSKSIDATIYFNASLGNVQMSVRPDSSIHYSKKKNKFEKVLWELRVKGKDTIASNMCPFGGGAGFLIPDALVGNDTTTWHYGGEDVKEGQKVWIVFTKYYNLIYSLFFSQKDYLLVGYNFEANKQKLTLMPKIKPSIKKKSFNQSSTGMYSDYRKVGNLLFPFKVVQTIGSDDKPHTTIFKDIRVSEDPLEDIFYIPQHLIDTLKSQD